METVMQEKTRQLQKQKDDSTENADEELQILEHRTNTVDDVQDFVERVSFPDSIGAIVCSKKSGITS